MYEHTYENFRRVAYDDWQFVPVCPKCGRFVRADDTIGINGLGEYSKEPNATCRKCGRVNMPCEGQYETQEAQCYGSRHSTGLT